MNSFFSFDPSKVLFNIQLAMSYTPRILENRITHRPYNGFLFVVRGAYTYLSKGESFTAHAGELIYLPAGSVPYSYFISDAGNGSVQTLQIEFALTDARSGSPLSFSDHPILVSTILLSIQYWHIEIHIYYICTIGKSQPSPHVFVCFAQTDGVAINARQSWVFFQTDSAIKQNRKPAQKDRFSF